MVQMYDETTYPYPSSLSPTCRKGIELLIQNGRETYGWLAKPSSDGQGVDFFVQGENPEPKGHARYAVFENP